MNFLIRGLYALTFIVLLQTQLSAEYLYKDEIIHNPKFQNEIELLGSDLFEKTGISLKLIMLKKLPKDENIIFYEKKILANFKTPTIIMVFSEMNSQVDILANDNSLYKYFNKKETLSPVASNVQAFLMAMTYAKNWNEFKEMMKYTDGSILPLLGGKAKKGELLGKYSAAMFNGYLDVAQQIAKSKNIKLAHDFGDSNQTTLFFVKLFFYSFVLYAIIMYIKRFLYRRRHKNG